MTSKKLSELTDEELMQEGKKLKRNKIATALIIGFMAGVVLYSIAKNTWGLLTLIPLFLIYKLVNNSKKDKDLEDLLKKRSLN